MGLKARTTLIERAIDGMMLECLACRTEFLMPIDDELLTQDGEGGK